MISHFTQPFTGARVSHQTISATPGTMPTSPARGNDQQQASKAQRDERDHQHQGGR